MECVIRRDLAARIFSCTKPDNTIESTAILRGLESSVELDEHVAILAQTSQFALQVVGLPAELWAKLSIFFPSHA